MRCIYIAFLMSLVCFISPAARAIDTIYYPYHDAERFKENAYYLALLKLALDHSKAEFGDYRLQKAMQPMFQGRALLEIKSNRTLSVAWTMTSPAREEDLAAIRIPLLRGLGGYRIFLIREGQQELFSQINNEQQLKGLFAGQGKDWPDSSILLDNGYQLVTGSGHSSLFNMLQYGRFDYMPRALHEPWNEVEIFEGLQVEGTLALHYPSPYYFFVSHDNPRLKNRIETGLRKAEANGSFKSLFENHPVTKNILAAAQLDIRKVFSLNNAFMSVETQKVVQNIPLFNFTASNQ